MWSSAFFVIDLVPHNWRAPLIQITDLYVDCKCENFKNQQCIKYLFSPLYMCPQFHQYINLIHVWPRMSTIPVTFTHCFEIPWHISSLSLFKTLLLLKVLLLFFYFSPNDKKYLKTYSTVWIKIQLKSVCCVVSAAGV